MWAYVKMNHETSVCLCEVCGIEPHPLFRNPTRANHWAMALPIRRKSAEVSFWSYIRKDHRAEQLVKCVGGDVSFCWYLGLVMSTNGSKRRQRSKSRHRRRKRVMQHRLHLTDQGPHCSQENQMQQQKQLEHHHHHHHHHHAK